MINENTETKASTAASGRDEPVVSLKSIRECIFRHEEKTGRYPKSIRLTPFQQDCLKNEAEQMNMVYNLDPKDDRPNTVLGVEIVTSDTVPHCEN